MLPVNSPTDFFTCPRQATREGNGSAQSTCSGEHNLMATHSLSVITSSTWLQSTDTVRQTVSWVSQLSSQPTAAPAIRHKAICLAVTSSVVIVLRNFAGTVFYFLITLVWKCPHLRESYKCYRYLERRLGVTILSNKAMPKRLNSGTKFTYRLPAVFMPFMLSPEFQLVGIIA